MPLRRRRKDSGDRQQERDQPLQGTEQQTITGTSRDVEDADAHKVVETQATRATTQPWPDAKTLPVTGIAMLPNFSEPTDTLSA